MGGISPPMGGGQMRRGGDEAYMKGWIARKFCDIFKGHFLLNDLLRTDSILEALRAKKGVFKKFASGSFNLLRYITHF